MRIRIMLIVLLRLLQASSVLAQSGGLELTLLSADPAEISSRFPASISIDVRNTSNSDSLIKAEALVAEDWGVLVLPEEFELAAGASKTVFITVNSPTTQAAGTYDVLTRFVPDAAGLATAELAARVKINPVENISISTSATEAGLYQSDEPISLSYQLVNMGNSTTTASLAVDVSPKWEFIVDTVNASLSPGSKTDVVVELTPPENLSFVTTVRLGLRVITASTSEEDPAARISTTINVLPGETPDLGNTNAVMEGDVATRLDYRDDVAIAIQGGGRLGGELGDGRQAAMEITTPSLSSTSTGYTRDSQYSASYLDPAWGFVDAGDITINLNSQLLSNSMSGFGALVGFDSTDLGARVSYTELDGYRQVQNTSAQILLGEAGTNYIQITAIDQQSNMPGSSTTAGLGSARSPAARQTSQISSSGSTKLYSVLGHTEPLPGWTVEAEAATSDSSGLDSGKAYALESRWYQPGFSVSGRVIQGSRTFTGSWGDTAYQDWNVIFKLAPEVRLWGNLNIRRNNVDDDPGYSGILRERLRYGTDLKLGKETSLRIALEDNSAVDEIQLTSDKEKTSTSIDLTQRWNAAQLSVSTEFGQEQDNISHTETDQLQYAVRGSFDIGSNNRLNLAYSLREDSSEGNTNRNENITAGASFALNDHSDLDVNVRWYDSTKAENEQLSANTTYRTSLANGHELQLRSQHSFGSFDDTSSIMLDYLIPLSVPLSGFALRAGVSGRVFLGSNPTGGIAETMVTIDGKTVVSDETGEFAFPALEPGLHTLQISPMSLAMGVSADPEKLSISADGSTLSLGTGYGYALIVPEVTEGEAAPSPAEFEIDAAAEPGWPVHFRAEAGQDIVIDLPVKVGARISGVVYEQEETLPGQMAETHLTAGAVIELVGPEKSRYRISDAVGRFLFTGLLPGTYQLSVRTERLADFCIAEPAAIELAISEGEVITDLTFTVQQKERTLEITEF